MWICVGCRSLEFNSDLLSALQGKYAITRKLDVLTELIYAHCPAVLHSPFSRLTSAHSDLSTFWPQQGRFFASRPHQVITFLVRSMYFCKGVGRLLCPRWRQQHWQQWQGGRHRDSDGPQTNESLELINVSSYNVKMVIVESVIYSPS